jgi:hypothetical protein
VHIFTLLVAVKANLIKQIGKNVTGVQGDVSNLENLIDCMLRSRIRKAISIFCSSTPVWGKSPYWGNFRSILRHNVKRQHQGASLYGTKGASTVSEKRLYNFERISLDIQSGARIECLERNQGHRTVIRSLLDTKAETPQDRH